jgi:hypothetical protein
VAEPDGPERREVEIGMDNDRLIRIVKGLSVGEKVLLSPPLAPSEAPFQQKSLAEAERKTESPGLRSTNGPVSKQKVLVPQEEKVALEETPSDIRENAKVQ